MRFIAAGLRAWMASNCASVRSHGAAGLGHRLLVGLAGPGTRPAAARAPGRRKPAAPGRRRRAGSGGSGEREGDARCYLSRAGKASSAVTYSTSAAQKNPVVAGFQRHQVGQRRRDHRERPVQPPGPGQEAAADCPCATGRAGTAARAPATPAPPAASTSTARSAHGQVERGQHEATCSPTSSAAHQATITATAEQQCRAGGSPRSAGSAMLPSPEKISMPVSTSAKPLGAVVQVEAGALDQEDLDEQEAEPERRRNTATRADRRRAAGAAQPAAAQQRHHQHQQRDHRRLGQHRQVHQRRRSPPAAAIPAAAGWCRAATAAAPRRTTAGRR